MAGHRARDVVQRSRRRGPRAGALGPASALLAVPALVTLGLGCGGAAPLLHPAHVLPVNTVSAGAGVSSQFVSDETEAEIERGRAAAGGSLSEAATGATYARGALLRALLGPGTAPWAGARVGLPGSNEAGLTYTGRALRLDARHAWPLGDEVALSLGVGATALLPDNDSLPPVQGEGAPGPAEFELNASGWGADVPLLVGYQSLGGFVEGWAGLRAGFERVEGELRRVSADPASARLDASGQRWWAGGLVGFSVGVPPLWLRFELATTFQQLDGEVASGADMPALGTMDAARWTLAPSGAIVGKF